MPKALLVDDEPGLRRLVRSILVGIGWEIVEASDGAEAVEALAVGAFDLVVTDLQMPVLDGMGLLREVRARYPQLPVVVLTASGKIPDVVAAIKAGAIDFVNKPFHAEELRDILVAALADSRGDAPRFRTSAALIGDSDLMRDLLAQVERVGPTEATIVVTGESGTGKEVIARLLHGASRRAGRPFVVVNCGAIPEALAESELFGHARGAFTGAVEKRVGRFVQAEGGTLFLDEIGELPLSMQAKLLRALQEREVTPVGEARPVRVDIRVVAATHRDLLAMVAAGKFREDLYYRLAVVPLVVPPLRVRAGDIPALARWFLGAARIRNRREVTIAPEVLDVIAGYPFPGNVRELENLIERLVVTDLDGVITLSDLPARARAAGAPVVGAPAGKLDDVLRDTEDRLIDDALARCDGSKARAAELLGINRTTLIEKLKRRERRD